MKGAKKSVRVIIGSTEITVTGTPGKITDFIHHLEKSGARCISSNSYTLYSMETTLDGDETSSPSKYVF